MAPPLSYRDVAAQALQRERDAAFQSQRFPDLPATPWSQDACTAGAIWISEKERQARNDADKEEKRKWAPTPPWRPAPQPKPLLPREHQLREGYFEKWLAVITPILQDHDLWHLIDSPPEDTTALDPEQQDQFERDDTWAVNLILMYISPTLLPRLPIPRPITSSTLFRILKQHTTTPFRLLDLPRELRDNIYAFVLVVSPTYTAPSYLLEQDLPIPADRLIRVPRVAFSTHVNSKPWLERHPALLAVSHQIRAEGDEIYWSRNQWSIEIDTKVGDEEGTWFEQERDLRTPRLQVQRWVGDIGIQRLRHLRDFTLGVNVCHKPARCGPVEFRITVDEKQGLRVKLPEWGCRKIEVRLDVHERHVAATEARRKEKGWKGEAIVDYILGNEEFWSEWFFSYPVFREIYF